METSRVSRIFRMVTALQSGQRYTADDLAKMLGMSRRTFFRDLNDLRGAGVPCHCDKKTHHYTIDSEFFLPPMHLNSQEALSLLLLVKARDNIHLPFKDLPLRAALKIENNLPGKIRQSCNTILRSISIKAVPQAKTELLNKIFAQLLKAILKKRVVNIRHYSPLKKKTIVTDLSPYHLRHDDYTWWVIGKSTFHKRVHTFELNQIRELNMLDECFTEDKEFDVDEYLGRAWSMTPEGRLYNIKLRFLPEVAHSVAEVQWHSTQTVTFEDDGSAIIEFRVDGLNEITWWILSYGDQAQVLAPKILRQKIIEIAQNTVKQSEQLLLA